MLVFAFLTVANAASGQNVSIALTSQNSGMLDLGQVGYIEMQICNTVESPSAAQNKLRPQMSVPASQLTILPSTQQTLPPGWTVFSNNGTAIRLSNTTDPIEGNTCVNILIAVQGVSAGTAPVTGQIFFNGSQTPGNNPSDDVSTTAVILPIVLGGFEAVIADCQAKINWHTEQELNTLKFIIEKSTDVNTWETVADVAAAGNSATRRNYTASDAKVESKKVTYYRLKAIDKDGKFSYSNIINVVSNCLTKKAVVFPNPVTNGHFVVFITGFAEKATASLRAADGRLMLSKNVTDGNNSFNVSSLASGTYFLSIADSNGNKIQQKLVITK